MFWNVLQIQIFFFFSNNYPVEIKLQQRTAKKALAAFFDVLFFCLRVCLHLRDFRIFGQPHNIIHRLSSFLMVGLNLTTKFLISEKIPFFLSFGTIFPDGGSNNQKNISLNTFYKIINKILSYISSRSIFENFFKGDKQ